MPKKVLLYLPFHSDFYTGLYIQMKKGFEQTGCIVEGGCGYLKGDELLKKIDSFQPDFVFEMNRVKSEIENFPKGLIHVCWLVDYWERTPHELHGSDFLYLFSHVWLKDHQNFTGKFIDVLYPGTDTDIYYPNMIRKSKPSMIFLGHMPKPWLDSELKRIISVSDSRNIKFEDLVPLVHEFALKPTDFHDGTISIKKFLLQKLGIKTFHTLDDRVLHYDIYARSFREGRRLGVVGKGLKSQNIDIYGGNNWELRKEFQQHYRGVLTTPEEINAAFNKNHCLLHDGNMPHFRVFDAMAAGLSILKPDVTGYGVEDEWKFLDFEEDSDVLTYSLESEELSYLNSFNSDTMREARMHIREKIVAFHTWTKRAEKILKDIEVCC